MCVGTRARTLLSNRVRGAVAQPLRALRCDERRLRVRAYRISIPCWRHVRAFERRHCYQEFRHRDVPTRRGECGRDAVIRGEHGVAGGAVAVVRYAGGRSVTVYAPQGVLVCSVRDAAGDTGIAARWKPCPALAL